jgi:hypothetical protein
LEPLNKNRVLVLKASDQLRNVVPLLKQVERSLDSLHRFVPLEFSLELVLEFVINDVDWVGILEDGERFRVENVVAEEAVQEFDDAGIPEIEASI